MDNNLPQGINISHEPGQVQITRKWSHPNIDTLRIWVVLWDIFFAIIARLWFLEFQFDLSRLFLNDPIATIAYLTSKLLFVSLPVLIGCYTLLWNYYAIALHINTTSLYANKKILSLKHHPLPFWGNMYFSSQAIRKLWITKTTYRGNITYNIHMMTSNKKKINFLSNLHTHEQALCIKQEIDDFLGLVNIL